MTTTAAAPTATTTAAQTATAAAAPQTTRTARTATAGTRRVRGLAVATATVSASVLYLAAKAAGTDFTLTDPGNPQPHPLILPEITIFALVFALLGWGTLALLEHLTHHAHTIWTTLATTVLLLSFAPIGIEHATTDTKIMLTLI
ncbi:DUF6069 family protein, partial [Actinomadura scrupuli]|uniref:DUF6069 family protein n=1 Tax=Actinomadura scrupuli TaxID=559629 RepID=UPI003D97304E